VTAKRHHYLPQCYLKGFVADRKTPRIFVVDLKERRPFETAPANVAAERDFHTIDVEGHPPDALENAFAKFETDLDQALRRIVAARSIAGAGDRAFLFNLIGLAATKNPRLREMGRDLRAQTAKMIMNFVTSTPERLEAHVRRAQEEGFLPPDEKVDYATMRKFVESGAFELIVPAAEHLKVELKVFDEVLPHIFNRKWILFRAPSGKTGFVTSDHPKCLTWSDPPKNGGFWPPGLGLRGTQLLFPISNDLAAIGAFEFKEEERGADETLVGMIIRHATRQVYARADDFPYVAPPDTEIRRGGQLLDHLFRREPAFQGIQ
jgi:hypothetical protein